MSYLEELFGLGGRVALVTGGYGHLGQAMCRALAAAGARVYCAGPSRQHFERAFAPPEPSGQIFYLPFDLRWDGDKQNQALAQIQREASKLDILVNNAFFLTAESAADFRTDMDGLLHHTVALTERALELLRSSEQGRIVNIASMYALVAPDPALYRDMPEFCSRASYNAAKAALLQLTRYWASFWGGEGLTVNAISPGPFPKMNAGVASSKAAEFCARLRTRTVQQRTGQPQDLAGALLLLASGAGAYITGANLVVDGGWTCR